MGCSPFSINHKPNHGLSSCVHDVAFEKIANRVKGAQMAGEALNI